MLSGILSVFSTAASTYQAFLSIGDAPFSTQDSSLQGMGQTGRLELTARIRYETVKTEYHDESTKRHHTKRFPAERGHGCGGDRMRDIPSRWKCLDLRRKGTCNNES